MRSILVLLIFIIFFVLFLPVLAVLFLLRRFNPRAASWATFYIIKAFLKTELFISGTRLISEGTENIPDEPVLFVGNHRSYYDSICTYVCMKMPTGYVGKKELQKIPVLPLWMTLMNSVFIDRHNIKEGLKSIIKAIEIVKDGYSMFIFPEGTRNRSEDKDVPADFKEGSLKIAGKSGCMIVPVAISGTENCFEAHVPWVKPADVRVSFLKPFYEHDIPEEYKKKPAAYTRMLIAEKLKP